MRHVSFFISSTRHVRPPRTHHQRPAGFTLIELLVVISILSLLSTLALIGFSNARVKARDAKRLSDMKQLHTALELCNQEGTAGYPAGPLAGPIPLPLNTTLSRGNILLTDALPKLPNDSLNAEPSPHCNAAGPGSKGCVLGVRIDRKVAVAAPEGTMGGPTPIPLNTTMSCGSVLLTDSIPKLPVDPINSDPYWYRYCNTAGPSSTTCVLGSRAGYKVTFRLESNRSVEYYILPDGMHPTPPSGGGPTVPAPPAQPF